MTGIDVISWLDGLVVFVEMRLVFIHLSFGDSMGSKVGKGKTPLANLLKFCWIQDWIPKRNNLFSNSCHHFLLTWKHISEFTYSIFDETVPRPGGIWILCNDKSIQIINENIYLLPVTSKNHTNISVYLMPHFLSQSWFIPIFCWKLVKMQSN